MLNFRSINDLNLAISRNIHRLDRTEFDVVVGIPRSGMLPASIISTALQLPLSDVESFSRGYAFDRSGKSILSGGRVLLVDDTSNRGGAMARAVKQIKDRAKAITRFAVFGPYRGDLSIIDIFCEIVPGPRAFEWNWTKHARLHRWAIDLDGVLCRDPSKQENDDGPLYENFINTAESLFLPQRPVGHIVTGRLEKYRGITDNWLKRHGIEYESMVMCPYNSKAERMAVGGRGQWKAEQIKKLPVELFIESAANQASIIARETGIPVWCIETQSLA